MVFINVALVNHNFLLKIFIILINKLFNLIIKIKEH